MGFFRGLGKFAGSTLFTTFLVLAILNMELVAFTSPENFRTLVSGIFESQLFSAMSEDELGNIYDALFVQCSQTDRVKLPFSTEQPLEIECADIRESGRSGIKSLLTITLADSVYYKEFDCDFVGCVTSGNPENMLIVVTNEGNQFYKSMQIPMWLGTIAGLAVLLVSVETWTGRLKGIGYNLVFIGLPFLLLGYAQDSLLPSIPPEIESSLMPVIDSLVSSLTTKFMIVLVVGIAFLVAGYAIAFTQRKQKRK